MNRMTVGLLATFVALLLGSGLLAYVLRDRAAHVNSGAPQTENRSGTGFATVPSTDTQSRPLLWQLFGSEASTSSPTSVASWESIAARIALRFSLAAFLAALLAFRPRRGVSISRRNPYVAQTQILMAVVAGRLIMVVGGSGGGAVGIFSGGSPLCFLRN